MTYFDMTYMQFMIGMIPMRLLGWLANLPWTLFHDIPVPATRLFRVKRELIRLKRWMDDDSSASLSGFYF